MKLRLPLLGLLLASACNMSDDYQDLGQGYTYVGESSNLKYIRDMRTGTAFHHSSVYPKVVRFDVDDSFIVAEQEPQRKEYKLLLGSDLGSGYGYYTAYLRDSVTFKQDWSAASMPAIRAFHPLYTELRRRGVTTANSSEDMVACEAVADSLLSYLPDYQVIFQRTRNYYIIDKTRRHLYGPYDYPSFQRQRQRLHLALDL